LLGSVVNGALPKSAFSGFGMRSVGHLKKSCCGSSSKEVKMQKIEFADADRVSELCQGTVIKNPQERAKLERYLTLRKEGTDCFQVEYKSSGIEGSGRLFVTTGLQSIGRDIRNEIAGKYYCSVSFGDSSNDPIKAHLRKEYGATPENIEPLKQHFCHIFDKLKPNQKLYYEILYSTERSVLMAMTDFFESKGWNVDCFLHQSILVRRCKDGRPTRQLFTECEKYIDEKTGVKVRVTVNPTL
jgi:hypothetical protein